MPIVYNPLWKLLIDNNINKTQLRNKIGIGTATLAKLSANEKVSLDIIEKICSTFNCQPNDIMEFIPDEITMHDKLSNKPNPKQQELLAQVAALKAANEAKANEPTNEPETPPREGLDEKLKRLHAEHSGNIKE